MNPTLIAAAVVLALSTAIGFGTAWEIQDANIAKINLGHANERIEQQRGARAAIDRATTAVITAQNAAAARDTRIAADAGRAGDAGNGLRLASATSVRASTSDSDACRAVVAAYGVILDEGSRLLGEVAAVADQCISDNKALTDSWKR